MVNDTLIVAAESSRISVNKAKSMQWQFATLLVVHHLYCCAVLVKFHLVVKHPLSILAFWDVPLHGWVNGVWHCVVGCDIAWLGEWCLTLCCGISFSSSSSIKDCLQFTDLNTWRWGLEVCLTVHLPHEIKWNANLMQQGNFIGVFLARPISGTYAHQQEH